jgi:hypothetical protein
MWMELLYHVPLAVWAIPALLRNDPKVPIHLLVYAVQTAVTTATCIADYLSWTTVTPAEKVTLGSLYVPYLALGSSTPSCLIIFYVILWLTNACVAVFMGVDMFGRLDAFLAAKSKGGIAKKRA